MSSRSDPMATSAPSASELAFTAAGTGTDDDIIILGGRREATWFIGSCAPNHMTGERSLLISMVQVNNQVVRLENGRVLPVRAIGSVSTEDVVLSNVWYVPGLHMNSVSVDQLTADHDLFVKMEGAVCLVTKNSDGSEVGRAHLRADYKYEVDSLIVQQN